MDVRMVEVRNVVLDSINEFDLDGIEYVLVLGSLYFRL
jgi:hypothetical protein